MIPISQIRNNSQEIIDRLARRGVDRSAEINRVLALDEEARAARFQLEQNLSRANQLAGFRVPDRFHEIGSIAGLEDLRRALLSSQEA